MSNLQRSSRLIGETSPIALIDSAWWSAIAGRDCSPVLSVDEENTESLTDLFLGS
jgi:hypothetical protein